VILALKFLADENFNNDILHGLRRLVDQVDIVRVQDIGLVEGPDPELLEWAAREGRIIQTHDVRTMPHHAHSRLGTGDRIAGVCIVPRWLGIARAIEDLVLIVQCEVEGDWVDRVRYLPL
jgi:Domain of unknown function (DUF5615)